jgi:gliding motility-associated-like protein
MAPSDEVNPVVTFPKIGKYQVSLVASSPLAAGGCTDQVTKTIEVKNDFNIYIPTSFSPNFDGLNDYFIPVFSEYGLDAKSFEMEIFDRWGHSLYRTKDITKGWDGSVQNKGEPLKEEVYIYRIKYKDMDGNAYSKMGHLSLLK